MALVFLATLLGSLLGTRSWKNDNHDAKMTLPPVEEFSSSSSSSSAWEAQQQLRRRMEQAIAQVNDTTMSDSPDNNDNTTSIVNATNATNATLEEEKIMNTTQGEMPPPTMTPTTVPPTAAPTTLPPTAMPTTVFSDSSAPPSPLGTNSWTQTFGRTDPFVFEGPPITAPPTTADEDYSYLKDYTDPRPLRTVGNDGKPRNKFPLLPCQGDCDSNRDCAGPLVCLQRMEGDPVPGCRGDASKADDYCVWPQEYRAPDGSIIFPLDDGDNEVSMFNGASRFDDGFCLKMYWEKGYFWQEENFERKCKYRLLLDRINACIVLGSL
jgi:hypothetical protein